MIKVFMHSMLSFLLVILLVANLAYFFQLPIIFGIGANDMSDKYIGVSHFFKFMQFHDWENTFLINFQKFNGSITQFMIDRLDGSIWSTTDFNFFDFLFNVLSYLILPFVLMFDLIMQLCYFIATALFVVINVFTFMGGVYNSEVPPYTYATTPVV